MRLNSTGNSFIFGRINRENAPRTFFIKLASRELPKYVWISQQAASFLDTNRGIAPTTFSVKLAGRELPECVWISRQTDSFLDAQIVELCPQRFLQNLHAENFRNASEFHGKRIRFWTHKLRKCAQNFVYKACKTRTYKIRLNITANRFIFGHINRGIAPRTFSVKLAGRVLSKCVWISRQTASFLNA